MQGSTRGFVPNRFGDDRRLQRRAPSMSRLVALLTSLALVGACAGRGEQTLVVKASAFNSVASQTDSQPSIAAWGDELRPGMRAIAVSRDLLDMGLTRGTRVRIDGLPGEYRVLDKMHRRWRRKIDIYMGEDVQAARQWGVREVRIHWVPAKP